MHGRPDAQSFIRAGMSHMRHVNDKLCAEHWGDSYDRPKVRSKKNEWKVERCRDTNCSFCM